MLTLPKQIVIDKDAFIGISLSGLCDFVQDHLLLVPHVLLYECATGQANERMRLLQRYERLVRAGAHYCPIGYQFAQWEGWRCQPYPSCLADFGVTESIRRGAMALDKTLDDAAVRAWYCSRVNRADAKLGVFPQHLKKQVDQHSPNIQADVKTLPSGTCERLRFFCDHAGELGIHDMVVRSLPSGWIRVPGEFCLSDEWITWHRMRLDIAAVYDSWYRNQTGGPLGQRRAEHDDQDIEYALLLSRADAIITKDKELVEPLARAAFPNKDVFSSLEEVPESYRCDRAGA